MPKQQSTHFGYQDIAWDEKQDKVNQVFHSVASNYDIMNDLMSGGVHRLWKRYAVHLAGVRPGDHLLDLAGGTGDISLLLLPRIGEQGHCTLSDINNDMLAIAKARLLDQGYFKEIDYCQANAEQLPMLDETFDGIIIAFGLRNVRDQQAALHEMQRVLRPGGRLTILEFSTPIYEWLRYWYDRYSFQMLPWLGELIAQDADSYRYLAESIRRHPDQASLQNMCCAAGLEDCTYTNLSGGIVAVHQGMKY